MSDNRVAWLCCVVLWVVLGLILFWGCGDGGYIEPVDLCADARRVLLDPNESIERRQQAIQQLKKCGEPIPDAPGVIGDRYIVVVPKEIE